MGVGPSCGSENQISEVDAGIEVIDGYHDVPAADVVDNDLIRDVVGNKTDARSEAVGIVSLVALLRETLAEVVEIEHHLHNRERWFGISGDQSGTDWAADTLTPFTAISGNNTYGVDADDEALVLGTSDTPLIAGMTRFDLHRIFIVDVSSDTPWKLRIIHGSGTMADAIAAGDYTEAVVMSDITNPQQSSGVPVELIMPRGVCGSDKVWIQAWNGTNNATIDFLIGLHEYPV